LEGQAGDEDFETDGAPSFVSQAVVDNDECVKPEPSVNVSWLLNMQSDAVLHFSFSPTLCSFLDFIFF
jgi:hypothetical protein